MVLGMQLASVIDQTSSWLWADGHPPVKAKSSLLDTVTSFADKAEAREHCVKDGASGNMICHCAEGHRCIQTNPPGAAVPEGEIQDFSGNAQWILGCPQTRANEDNQMYAITGYNQDNPDCKGSPPKCTCVLNREPTNGEGTEVIRVPTVHGDPHTLHKRFLLLNLTPAYVNSVKNKGGSNSQPTMPEPLILDAKDWKEQFPEKAKMMQEIMDYLTKEMKVVEEDEAKEVKAEEAAAAEANESPSVDAQPPASEQNMTPQQQDEVDKERAGEMVGTSIIDQFENMQDKCRKMEDTAIELGMTKGKGEYEEGGVHMNCHLDYKEKKAVEKAIEGLMKTVEETPTGAMVPIDVWTVGPIAALANLAQCSRTAWPSCITNAHRYRGGSAWHRQAGDFIAPRPLRAGNQKTARLQDLQQFLSS
mmetsp:Transcript_14186/g.25043  ORF Transcript_14186/g.25043 Transcript_14186/m.25043 type:complete len:419 (-) Transcript_14186:18-1274(-)